MTLISMKRLLNHALVNKYAVGYFEAWNMDSILAVVDAAEKTNSPVIIGFGGQFIGSARRTVEENIYHYGSLGKSISENTKVPVALLLNEAHEIPMLINGLKAGFNAIMYEDHSISLREFIEINAIMVYFIYYEFINFFASSTILCVEGITKFSITGEKGIGTSYVATRFIGASR